MALPMGSPADVSLTVSDELLISRVAAGDKLALERLYDRYERLVYSFALRQVGDPQLAEEVVQDVFFRLWRHAGRFDRQRGRFTSWLLNITHNLAIDKLRQHRHRALVPLETVETIAEAVGTAPQPATADLAEAAVMGELVRDALAALKPEQRQALEMAYYQGYTHTEIAELCQVPLGTVKGRLRLALERLRGLLAIDGGTTKGGK